MAGESDRPISHLQPTHEDPDIRFYFFAMGRWTLPACGDDHCVRRSGGSPSWRQRRRLGERAKSRLRPGWRARIRRPTTALVPDTFGILRRTAVQIARGYWF